MSDEGLVMSWGKIHRGTGTTGILLKSLDARQRHSGMTHSTSQASRIPLRCIRATRFPTYSTANTFTPYKTTSGVRA